MQKPSKPIEREFKKRRQTICFQIADGNSQLSCIVETKLPTKVQAQQDLVANRPIIEKLARDALSAGTMEDGQIKLVMI